MLKAIIVDDDPRDREVLETLLKKYCSDDILLAGTAENIDSGYQLILDTKPELVFLDVELGTSTGFDLLSKFSSFNFRVIFVTAYEKYALQAIKFNALDYILKPVVISELVQTIRKTREQDRLPIDSEIKNLLHTLQHPFRKTNRIAVPLLNGYKLVSVEDITYCEAHKEYTFIHTVSAQPVCSSTNLGEYEDLLQGYSFCRVHHSYLVNKEHVQQYIKGEGGELIIEGKKTIPVSRRKKQDVINWLTIN